MKKDEMKCTKKRNHFADRFLFFSASVWEASKQASQKKFQLKVWKKFQQGQSSTKEFNLCRRKKKKLKYKFFFFSASFGEYDCRVKNGWCLLKVLHTYE
jgi:hypothetical protein